MTVQCDGLFDEVHVQWTLEEEESLVISATGSGLWNGWPCYASFALDLVDATSWLSSLSWKSLHWLEGILQAFNHLHLAPSNREMKSLKAKRRTFEISEARFSLFSGQSERQLQAWGFGAPLGWARVTIWRAKKLQQHYNGKSCTIESTEQIREVMTSYC